MTLLEEPNHCALCPRPVGGGSGGKGHIPVYLCAKCYSQWQMEYLAREAWLVYLENAEKQRRKRRNRLIKSVGLPHFTNTVAGEVL